MIAYKSSRLVVVVVTAGVGVGAAIEMRLL